MKKLFRRIKREKTDPAEPRQKTEPSAKTQGSQDASRGEVALYAFGNIEDSAARQFLIVLQQVLVVAMHVHPMLIGLILGIRTFFDAITDPIMAYITDNARTRWGRRRPFILAGGTLRMLLLVAICAFIPRGGHLTPNRVMEAQKFANEAIRNADLGHEAAVKTLTQIEGASPGVRAQLLDMLAEKETSVGEAIRNLDENTAVLQEDAAGRSRDVEARQHDLEAVRAQFAGTPELEAKEVAAQGLVDFAEGKLATADTLLKKADKARRQAIAAGAVSRYVLDAFPDPSAAPQWGSREEVQARANTAYASAGLEPLNVFAIEAAPPPAQAPQKKSSWEKIKDGAAAFNDPKNAAQRSLLIFVLVAFLLFALFTTIQSVPYYALGIELAPSYDGRTRVVTYRSFVNYCIGIVTPWIPAFVFALWFTDAVHGLFWAAVFICIIGIFTTVLMVWKVRSRTEISTVKKKPDNIFLTMWQLAKNPHFLRIFALYVIVGLANGLFQQVSFFLNVYWVMGSALSGAKLGGMISMVAWGMGILSLPLINWGCRRFQKHRALGFAVIWMAIGSVLKWWCMNPDHPEYQFILPFFFSVGISSVYTILPTLMADVTDMDELQHGVRREGMFGAVMAFMMKTVSTLTPILAGVALSIAGINPSLEYKQLPETIFRLRLMDSFIPASMLVLCLLVLWRYPLTRKKVEEVKAELHRRHQAEKDEA